MPATPDHQAPRDRDAADATDLDPGGSVTPGATPPDTNPVSGSVSHQPPPPQSRFSKGAIFTFVVVGAFVLFLIVYLVFSTVRASSDAV